MVVANKRRALPRGNSGNASGGVIIQKPKKKSTKSFDITLLARGMTARCIGARIASQLTILSSEEMEKDLRHMEAYQNACIAYNQQFFIHHNRSLVQSGHYGPMTSPTNLVSGSSDATDSYYDPYRPVMPVRIDPEEEKRISLLRQRIASSEAAREVLETEYMSLRAHYVHASQRVKKSRQMVTAQLTLLKQLVQRRGKVVALRRVRVGAARDVLLSLERRTILLDNRGPVTAEPTAQVATPVGGPDMLETWNNVESLLSKAEKACRMLELDVLSKRVRSKSPPPSKRKRGDTEEENGVIPQVAWDGRAMPRTPYGMPILISQMSEAPDKSAGFGCGGVFGSNESSLVFLEENLPSTYGDMEDDQDELLHLRNEAKVLCDELQRERRSNKDLQRQIIQKRKRNDEMCAMMTLLRSETEAVLARHNILLDTQEARQAASDLHQNAFEDREERGETGVDMDEGEIVDELINGDFSQESGLHEEHDNDGDDEGSGGDDYEEEGELMEQPPTEVILGKDEAGEPS